MTRFIAPLLLLSCASTTATPPQPSAPSESAELATPAANPDPRPVCRDAVVLVLDKSGSMNGAPLEGAKDGAKRLFSKLEKDDCYSVVAFDSNATRVVKLAPGGDRVLVDTAIDALQAGGGTHVFAALDIAHEDLKAAKAAKRKIMILLTDGQSPRQGIEAIADQMASEKMRFAALGYGAAIDEPLLRTMADKTKGSLRKVAVPGDLPKILEEELVAARR